MRHSCFRTIMVHGRNKLAPTLHCLPTHGLTARWVYRPRLTIILSSVCHVKRSYSVWGPTHAHGPSIRRILFTWEVQQVLQAILAEYVQIFMFIILLLDIFFLLLFSFFESILICLELWLITKFASTWKMDGFEISIRTLKCPTFSTIISGQATMMRKA